MKDKERYRKKFRFCIIQTDTGISRMLFWSGKPLLPTQGLEADMIRTEGWEFGRSGDNTRKGKKKGVEGKLSLVRSLGANDANLPCKSRHISRHRAMEGRSCEPTLYHPFSPVRQPPTLALFYRYHAPFCGSGGGWKVFRVVILGVITPHAGDESKIPWCKCDRPLSGGPPKRIWLICAAGLPPNLSATIWQIAAEICQLRRDFYKALYTLLLLYSIY